ncbi:hypothetical protein H2202_004974 [Exophiala xenobiotica]|nr:hypothetical protein H2202_004974 [Exophiala xenobiotica]
MSSTPSTLTPTLSSPFLSLPSELRLKIYTYVLTSSEPITITPSSPTSHQFFQFLSFDIELDFASLSSSPSSSSSSPPSTPNSIRTTMSPKLLTPCPSVSAQFLRTSRLIHTEATPILYTSNTFNCSSRSALPILLQTLTPTTSPLITHLILDWDQLQDFSWSLSKPATVHATSHLAHARGWRLVQPLARRQILRAPDLPGCAGHHAQASTPQGRSATHVLQALKCDNRRSRTRKYRAEYLG